VVSVLVVHREKLSVGIGKFPAATGADEPKQRQGSFTVVLAGGFLLILLHLPDQIFGRPVGYRSVPDDNPLDSATPTCESHLRHGYRFLPD
jgi:hypothetical protein